MRHDLKEAGLQNPVLTNRNGIGGYEKGISKHGFAKSKVVNRIIVDTAGIGGRKMLLPGEISGRFRNANGEVSRGHSSYRNEPALIAGWTHGDNEGLNEHRSGI